MATVTEAPPPGLSLREGVSRQLDYWWTVYRRTWKGSVISSFVSPVFYVVAMGVILGGFIAGDPARLEGASSYLAFVVPGLVAAHAMQTAVAETTYPVMGMVKWQKVYFGMLATPLTSLHVVMAHLLFVLLRVAVACGVFMLVLAPFGLYVTWWGPFVAYLAQLLTGAAFGALTYAMSIRMTSESGFGVYFRLVVFPLFLFSGAFFPVDNLGEFGAAVARLTPLWHGVNLSRMYTTGSVDVGLTVLNVVVLAALTVLGTWWSITGLRKRVTD